MKNFKLNLGKINGLDGEQRLFAEIRDKRENKIIFFRNNLENEFGEEN